MCNCGCILEEVVSNYCARPQESSSSVEPKGAQQTCLVTRTIATFEIGVSYFSLLCFGILAQLFSAFWGPTMSHFATHLVVCCSVVVAVVVIFRSAVHLPRMVPYHKSPNSFKPFTHRLCLRCHPPLVHASSHANIINWFNSVVAANRICASWGGSDTMQPSCSPMHRLGKWRLSWLSVMLPGS